MNFIQTNWLSLIILALVIFLFFSRNPFGCNPPEKPKIDTVTTTKTEYIPQPTQYIPVYIPSQTGSQPPIVIPPNYQPSRDYEALIKQYNELVQKYLAVNSYKDSIKLKDSSGVDVGTVNLQDVISENAIKSRDVNYKLKFPVTTITNTITIREPYVPRNQLYVGGGLTGTTSMPVNGAAAEIWWKNKKDQMYGVDIGAMSIGGKIQPVYGIKTLWKIKLR